MKVSIIGVGDMGQSITGHVLKAGHEVMAYDLDPEKLSQAQSQGALVASSLAQAASFGEVHLIIVATDAQSADVSREIFASGRPGSVLVIVGTNNLATMQSLAELGASEGFGFVDAPVVFGRKGADEGNLVSLAGGKDEHVSKVTPILESYSRAVHHVGAIGAGQLAKTCNNMLHWAACVANFEVLLVAKRYGIDAQKMREILLDCPGHNVTLKRWDTTRFTWHEKDMDVALDIAQSGKIPMPMFGLVDQLVKQLSPQQVKELLYGDKASYLGSSITPMSLTEGSVGH